jgi:hypothetical protein
MPRPSVSPRRMRQGEDGGAPFPSPIYRAEPLVAWYIDHGAAFLPPGFGGALSDGVAR